MSEQSSIQLDTLETSINSAPPESYRKFCISHCEDEYDATLAAYEDFDLEDDHERAYTLEQCRTGAWFTRNVHTGKVKVLSSSCHLRWCPMCASTRRWFLTQQVSEWLKTTKQPKFLTLTLVHSDAHLNEQVENLYKCFRRYRNLKLLKTNVKGGVWFFQIHRSKSDGLWHPHLHCVIDSPWIDKFQLSERWKFVTKTSEIICIKHVKDAESMSEYVARYAARPSMLTSLNVPERFELIKTLHGRRLVGTWGSAKSIVLRPSKPLDADDWVKVGSWREVFWTHDSDVRAAAIWRAYKNDTELAEDCNILPDSETGNLSDVVWHRTELENKQLFLDFY